MPTILVTGGSGFIGSHTCTCLLKSGFDIIIFDNHSNSNVFPSSKILCSLSIDDASRLKIYDGDVCKTSDLENVFQASENGIDAVIHFAGLKSVPESFSNPIKYWKTNVSGTINVLDVMSKFSCKNIIFSSSATIYGGGQGNQIVETDLINPTSPYGWSKYISEKIIEDKYNSLQIWQNNSDNPLLSINAIILRYFNPVGALKNGIIGESPQISATNLFPAIMQVLTRQKSHLNIFGNDWPTIDGTGIRDFVHVMDIAEGHVAAINYLLAKEDCLKIINLGTGVGHTVMQVINMFEEIVGENIPYRINQRREGDVASCVADISLASSTLNWKSRRSLSEMCLDSWNFWKKNSA